MHYTKGTETAGIKDCGLFALAFATDIAHGQTVFMTKVRYVIYSMNVLNNYARL